MNWILLFFANSILLGVGLAMDAFSVSIVNAIAEPGMRRRRVIPMRRQPPRISPGIIMTGRGGTSWNG